LPKFFRVSAKGGDGGAERRRGPRLLNKKALDQAANEALHGLAAGGRYSFQAVSGGFW
jgi:hypothetical protein